MAATTESQPQMSKEQTLTPKGDKQNPEEKQPESECQSDIDLSRADSPDEQDHQHADKNHNTNNNFTPAVVRRSQASKHLIVQSPTDNIFSPISRKLLGKKRHQ